MNKIRKPAVSDLFYPADPDRLKQMVKGYLESVTPGGNPPKGVIAPHAGYIYSGPIAASAYARLVSVGNKINQVVLLGPSHRVPFYGLAISEADYFRTPLGDIPLDHQAIKTLQDLPQVIHLEAAHANEHSLEVQLPFLQLVLDQFKLIPLVVGDATGEQVAEVLTRLWGGEETLIVISSDLSHYHDYLTAQRMDQATSEAIVMLHPDALGFDDACGRIPVQGFLLEAKRMGLHGELVDLRNSGDTAGSKDQVVGYGAYAFSGSTTA
ncbi:MAG: AmmeMemoRadiSam system protein B [Candidatus Thiodiazotropha sp. (ex Lucinoma annulata)]|nr:AmmeMemoRadiSam system protein B [Candidatus Thiodiazotropha sp. (ex Lucinoma borealis)]MCU7840333.1 AmmeMemoRadiSam system protein B [Candidatus Thiodiazotropha sp. (ex Troendleina suluensis)]MCU7865814.1 AmmeMemoRadiSam system protein B [Candidatus Thiodiazotropha sp. (ex Lucinoma borealis)]MCU7883084.1 AmmeMemoRadiSam system protein B [Candidatus Thiodiazotropha sp. (ex Lucinoma annulata)]MCU7946921.1 AmmeMemoRadiSam system protein B [Candidatus Thiodiazotropha sp. (ex Cardiolucina cf. qu